MGALAARTSLRQEEEFVGVANAHLAESGIAELAPAGWALADYSVGPSAAGWAPAGWVLGDCSVRLWVDDSVRHDSPLADYSVGPSAEGWAPAGWVRGRLFGPGCSGRAALFPGRATGVFAGG